MAVDFLVYIIIIIFKKNVLLEYMFLHTILCTCSIEQVDRFLR